MCVCEWKVFPFASSFSHRGSFYFAMAQNSKKNIKYKHKKQQQQQPSIKHKIVTNGNDEFSMKTKQQHKRVAGCEKSLTSPQCFLC